METWIPPGVQVESKKKLNFGIVLWTPPGPHLESMDSTWIPPGFNGFQVESRWNPYRFFLIFKNRHSTKNNNIYLNTYFIIYIKLFILNLLHLYFNLLIFK